MKPTAETRQVLDWILTEIGAGMCLLPQTPEEQTWNDAHERAEQIIQGYRDGNGLFQMTAHLGKQRVQGKETAGVVPLR
jgi:hypothetical protein